MKRKRKVKRLDRYEKNLEYMERVRHAYLRLAKEKRWKIVDGVRSRKEVEEEIWAYI
ncbi:MAG: dTMP kinase, partial [Nitrososphaeria archaeon]|nr:dTMP kinase [Nitrososphaeria archaeon]